MKTIAVYNNKGGVGKTTSVVSIGATLCTLGYTCLLVDLDSQGCLGELLLHEKEHEGWERSALEKIISSRAVNNLTQVTSFKYYDRQTKTFPYLELDLIPSTRDLATYEFKQIDELKDFLAPAAYDFCLIDMPPSNADVTYVGLCAADYLLTPFKADRFSASAIENVESIYRDTKRINKKLKFIGAFITDFDTRYKISAWTKENFEESPLFFTSYVRHAACFDEANLAGKPIVCLTGSSGAEDYLAVTKEMLERTGERHGERF